MLAATGPVGRRVVQLLAAEGTRVRVASRREERATTVCDHVLALLPDAQLTPYVAADEKTVRAAIGGAQIVIAAGAPGVELLPADARQDCGSLQVAIDLSAVPPLGIGGIEVTDKAVERAGQICYGAIGVGGTKMRIHKAAIRQLFASNDQVLDAADIYALGKLLEAK